MAKKPKAKQGSGSLGDPRLYPKGVPVDDNGMAKQDVLIPLEQAQKIPVDAESARVSEQSFRRLARKAAGESEVRWNNDEPAVRYWECYRAHPGCWIIIKQTQPVRDESIPRTSFQECPTYDDLKAWVKQFWSGQRATFQWIAQDGTAPQQAQGVIEFQEDPDWMRRGNGEDMAGRRARDGGDNWHPPGAAPAGFHPNPGGYAVPQPHPGYPSPGYPPPGYLAPGAFPGVPPQFGYGSPPYAQPYAQPYAPPYAPSPYAPPPFMPPAPPPYAQPPQYAQPQQGYGPPGPGQWGPPNGAPPPPSPTQPQVAQPQQAPQAAQPQQAPPPQYHQYPPFIVPPVIPPAASGVPGDFVSSLIQQLNQMTARAAQLEESQRTNEVKAQLQQMQQYVDQLRQLAQQTQGQPQPQPQAQQFPEWFWQWYANAYRHTYGGYGAPPGYPPQYAPPGYPPQYAPPGQHYPPQPSPAQPPAPPPSPAQALRETFQQVGEVVREVRGIKEMFDGDAQPEKEADREENPSPFHMQDLPHMRVVTHKATGELVDGFTNTIMNMDHVGKFVRGLTKEFKEFLHDRAKDQVGVLDAQVRSAKEIEAAEKRRMADQDAFRQRTISDAERLQRVQRGQSAQPVEFPAPAPAAAAPAAAADDYIAPPPPPPPPAPRAYAPPPPPSPSPAVQDVMRAVDAAIDGNQGGTS